MKDSHISPIFIDTNILIYAYSDTEIDKKARTVSILETEAICLSTQVINEFVWVMNRKFNVELITLRTIVESLFEIYKVALITKPVIDKAIIISSKFKLSYWDSLMAASAIESDCCILYTEDLQHRQVIEEKLTVINPFL